MPRAQKQPPANRPNRKRLILLYLVINVLVVPIAFLGLMEVVLRLIGFGYPAEFFTQETVGGKTCYVTNYKFAWRFFPKPMARLPAPLAVPVEKGADVIRVVVLGSSAAQGDPEPIFSFSRILEVMLRERYPGKKIEVYNTAATAINSNVILPIARDSLKIKPDLFVVYSGNNEVIGPYGLSAVLTPFFSSRAVIKTRIWIGQTKVGQFCHSLAKEKTTSSDEWHGMELFLRNKISHDDPNLQKIYSHFHDNIAEICQLAKNAGIKVVLSTVIANEADCAPFVSLHRPGLDNAGLEKWDALFAEAKKLEAAQQWSPAIDAYSKAAALDAEYAELQFRLGRCQLQLNRTNDAAQCFSKARDYDALRFRADSQINQVIRQVATEAGNSVTLVDADARARQNVPNGVPGATLLYEHVHLNFDGNYLLADTVREPMEKLLALQSQKATPDVETCKAALGYTAHSEKRICDTMLLRVKAAPFANRYSNEEEIKRMQDTTAAASARIKGSPEIIDTALRTAVAARPGDWGVHYNYMDFLILKERYPDALREAEATYNLIPFAYLAMVNMGVTQSKNKHYDEAQTWLNKAIEQNPYFTHAYEAAAGMFEDQKKFDKAAEFLAKSGAGSEQMALFYNRAGIATAKDRQFDAAMAFFKTALSLKPSFPEAATNLKNTERRLEPGNQEASKPEVSEEFNHANGLLKAKEYLKAIEIYQKVISEEPQFVKAHNNLGFALVQLKRYDEALQQFNEAIRIEPRTVEAYPNAASILAMNNRHSEAVELLRKAVDLRPSPQLYEFLASEYLKLGNSDAAQLCREQAKQLK